MFEEVLWVEAGHHGVLLSVDDEGWTGDQRQKLHTDTPYTEHIKVNIRSFLALIFIM